MDKKLTPEEFALRAIEKLAKPGHTCIHVVFSGYNTAFREYFPDLDVREETDKLVAAGKLSKRPARGGAIIAKPGDLVDNTAPSKALSKMGL